MLNLFISFILLTSDVGCKPDYEYQPETGWLKLQKVTATWKEAFFHCHNEGAVLASPITEELKNKIRGMIVGNNKSISYFIGTHARFSPKQYVSIEGVPLENMPVMDMFQQLNAQDGECLSTNGNNISVTSCMEQHPYLCYRAYEKPGRELETCGTNDKEYRLETTTGSCYKVHSRDLRTWADANSVCISEGGYLVILNNDQEALVVKNMIPDIKLDFTWDKKWDPLYIGLRDWSGNGTWLSIHGDPMQQLFDVWEDEDGQPDITSKHCGALTRHGLLDNVWCNLVSFFVCEKDPQNNRFLADTNSTFDIDVRMNY